MLLPYSSTGLVLARRKLLRTRHQVAFDHQPNTLREPSDLAAMSAPRPAASRAACCCWRGCSPPSASAGSLAASRSFCRRPPRWLRRSWALPPRRITWQSLLPFGVDDGHLAILVHRQEVVARLADWMASVAMRMLPSVPFLKPIGADRPEASSRCTWLSVVRAPMAPQAIRSPMYWGEITSRNSLPAGTPRRLISMSNWRAMQALVDAVALVQVGVVDEALPAHGGARLFEVHAHHDFQRVLVLLAHFLQAAGIVQRPPGHGWSRARSPPAGGRPCRHDLVDGLAGLGDQLLHRRATDGKKRIRCSGGQHGDVLDAFVVGLAGFLDALVPGITGAQGLWGSWVLSREKWKGLKTLKTKTAGLCSFGGWVEVLGACALASHPPGTENQNQK